MKHLLLIVLTLSCAFATKAQSYCGFDYTPDMRAWQASRSIELQQLHAEHTRSIQYVPIQIHILGNDNGAGYFLKSDAYQMICELNQRYVPMDIQFYLFAPPTYINNSTYYANLTQPLGNQMMNLYNEPLVCNVYVVNNMTGICGYAFGPSSGPAMGRGGIALKKSCVFNGSTTLTHEMGHYFTMLHTFQDWNTPNLEYVNESNCATKGDHFCDTRADFLDYRWDCPYTGTQTDVNGDLYYPDSSLYMGYSNEPCPTRFSDEQQAAIIYSRQHDRPYLDSVPIPSFASLSLSNLLTPMDSDTNVPSSSNAFFSWNKVAGATDYNLRIKLAEASTFTPGSFNVFTNDTFTTINGLLANHSYDWQVLPVNATNTCMDAEAINLQRRNFSVVLAVSGINDISLGSEVMLFPNPIQNQKSITIQVHANAASTTMVQLMDVNGRVLDSVSAALNIGVNNINILIQDLPNGVYMINLKSNTMNATRKFIKLNME